MAELEKALELGATNILATSWDRIENTLYPEQNKALKHMIPDLIVSIAAGETPRGPSRAGGRVQCGDRACTCLPRPIRQEASRVSQRRLSWRTWGTTQ